MAKVIDYLKGSRDELKKVVWPTWLQTREHALAVIAVSLIVAAFLGIMDFIIERFILPIIL